MTGRKTLVTGTERKRRWRLAHPERRREYERRRAQARRNGHWGRMTLGGAPLRECMSSTSYVRYENSVDRFRQRLLYPRYGAGAHRWTREALHAAGDAMIAQAVARLEGGEASA